MDLWRDGMCLIGHIIGAIRVRQDTLNRAFELVAPHDLEKAGVVGEAEFFGGEGNLPVILLQGGEAWAQSSAMPRGANTRCTDTQTCPAW